MKEYIAHIRLEEKSKSIQPLREHLEQVAKIASSNASKIGLSKAGELIGLLHDLGKYSKIFQNYIRSATGIISQGENEYVDVEHLIGKIDHSTSGAQYIWNSSKNSTPQIQIVAQVLSLCIASHHSGLIDCINLDGIDEFEKRMAKSDSKCHLSEASNNADSELIEKVNHLITNNECVFSITEILKKITKTNSNEILRRMQAGLLIRMLFSCLIDADRIDTSDFENITNKEQRQNGKFQDWTVSIDRLEKRLRLFNIKSDKNPIDNIREEISNACLHRAHSETGVFTLTVPTGGGKTLASLRFALHHAKVHKLDRIIYVVPYTSIIDQNANVVREILELDKHEKGRIVLEHHSNLLPERQNWKTKILTENWDAPIIYTTSVQFLETFFNGGTRSVRRMHQLARSVIVFDEIQTLPVKTTHLFCNAINFLTNHCNSSVVLCTATQPLLNKVSEKKGRINFSNKNEIIPDVKNLFRDLKRVKVINRTKPQGWEISDIAQLAIEQVKDSISCLIIVNTKKNAQEVYETCCQMTSVPVFHLSTSMCPEHRMDKLNKIRSMLELNEPFICASTQLIEAGVDVDFGSVIRFVAGIDSIAQAAGRCNRNGNRVLGKVFVVNPKYENIDSLHDIKIGRDISTRVFNEMSNPEAGLTNDMIHPSVMERYFQYYFYNRAGEMSYSIDTGRDDNLLNLLSVNSISVSEYERINDHKPKIYFRQAFGTAGDYFNAIDATTQGIVVPYLENGEKVISDFFSKFAVEQQYELLRKAQKYTVNVFPNVIKKLNEQKAIREVPEIGVLVLADPRFYHPEFGLAAEIKTEYKTLITD